MNVGGLSSGYNYGNHKSINLGNENKKKMFPKINTRASASINFKSNIGYKYDKLIDKMPKKFVHKISVGLASASGLALLANCVLPGADAVIPDVLPTIGVVLFGAFSLFNREY